VAGHAPRRRGAHAAPPQRTCVVCRQCAAAEALVQLRRVGPGAAAVAGRGGYVCISAGCLAQFLRKNASVNPSIGDLADLAKARLLDLLGLARRCGVLLHGIGKVSQLHADHPATVLVATDLIGKSAVRLAHHLALAPAAVLGHAAGLPEAGAVAIMGGRLSLQAAYWQRVWYEASVVKDHGAPKGRSRVDMSNAPEVAR
jgi:hypothetical protein